MICFRGDGGGKGDLSVYAIPPVPSAKVANMPSGHIWEVTFSTPHRKQQHCKVLASYSQDVLYDTGLNFPRQLISCNFCLFIETNALVLKSPVPIFLNFKERTLTWINALISALHRGHGNLS